MIVSDIRLPGASGLELLAQCHERAPEVPVILVTGHGDISMAVQAMRDGAYDFIEKPFASERLIEAVRRALERRKLVLENLALRRELAGQSSVAPRIIGRSPAIEQVRQADRERRADRRLGADQRRHRRGQGVDRAQSA